MTWEPTCTCGRPREVWDGGVVCSACGAEYTWEDELDLKLRLLAELRALSEEGR